MADGKLVQVDSRGRVSLGAVARREYYIARVEDDGTIIMEPVIVLTQVERDKLGTTEEETNG